MKNGDEWTVTGTHADGSLTVRRVIAGAMATLPVGYVAEHVELAYATTAYRAQGRNVDRAHAYISLAATRGTLYVMASRGVHDNELYIDKGGCNDLEEMPAEGKHTAQSVLLEVLENTAIDLSATEALAHEWLAVTGRRGAVRPDPPRTLGAAAVRVPVTPCA